MLRAIGGAICHRVAVSTTTGSHITTCVHSQSITLMARMVALNSSGSINNNVTSTLVRSLNTFGGPHNSCNDEECGPGVHQTPIVDMLWKQRQRKAVSNANSAAAAAATAAAAAAAAAATNANNSSNTQYLTPKTPKDSLTSVVYEFSSNALLRESYGNPWGFIRMGRVIEDLDALAGNIAAAHCQEAIEKGSGNFMLVTASVDRIAVKHRANLQDDMTLSGSVVWVGKSSMEIALKLVSSWSSDPWLSATFVFVARDSKSGKAALMPPLTPESADEIQEFQAAQIRYDERKKARAASVPLANLIAAPSAPQPQQRGQPTRAEHAVILARELLQEARPLIDMPALANRDAILMSSTLVSNCFICQPQQRNTHGRIFGGFLMRRAFELAFATAYLFIGSQPQFREVDEITFQKPVDVGNLVRFESIVLYTSHSKTTIRPLVHIEVVANVTRPEERVSFISNTFHFIFEKRDGGTVRRVLPGTEEQARRVAEYLSDPSRPDII
jgi:acyl-coenzyme A thioesterase 9